MSASANVSAHVSASAHCECECECVCGVVWVGVRLCTENFLHKRNLEVYLTNNNFYFVIYWIKQK